MADWLTPHLDRVQINGVAQADTVVNVNFVSGYTASLSSDGRTLSLAPTGAGSSGTVAPTPSTDVKRGAGGEAYATRILSAQTVIPSAGFVGIAGFDGVSIGVSFRDPADTFDVPAVTYDGHNNFLYIGATGASGGTRGPTRLYLLNSTNLAVVLNGSTGHAGITADVIDLTAPAVTQGSAFFYQATIPTSDSAPHALLSIPIAADSCITGTVTLNGCDASINTLGAVISFTARRVGSGAVTIVGSDITRMHNDITGPTLTALSDFASGGATSLDFAVNSGGTAVRWSITVNGVGNAKP